MLLLVPPEETSGTSVGPGGPAPLLPESVGLQTLGRVVSPRHREPFARPIPSPERAAAGGRGGGGGGAAGGLCLPLGFRDCVSGARRRPPFVYTDRHGE